MLLLLLLFTPLVSQSVAVPFWDADWLIDCVTLASPNACCGCGIAPTPIKDIVDSSTAAVVVANIASLGHFRFLFPEFPVERRFIVEVHTLMVNMKCGAVFEFEIRFLDSEL